MNFDTPCRSSLMRVKPEWIDYNGHLNMAYYNVMFDQGVDEAFIHFGLGPDYVKRTGASFYTLENHVCYLRELHEGDPVRVTLQLLDFDDKRTHFFAELRHGEKDFLSATSEQIHMHVDMNVKRAAAFPPQVLENIRAMHEAHKSLPRSPHIGSVIAIKRKTGQ